MLADRPKKDLPPQGSQEVGEIYEFDSVQNVPPGEVILQQSGPLETGPSPKLQVHEPRQDHCNDSRRYSAVFPHLSGISMSRYMTGREGSMKTVSSILGNPKLETVLPGS